MDSENVNQISNFPKHLVLHAGISESSLILFFISGKGIKSVARVECQNGIESLNP